MKLSDRINELQFSPIRKFNVMAKAAENSGKKIYRLNIGQPDIATPKAFMKAIKKWDEEVLAYAESDGNTELLYAICQYFKMYNLKYTPRDIVVTAGGSEALNMVFTCILNPGDEVLIPEPFYANYHTFVSSAAGTIVPIATYPEEGFKYAFKDRIEALITDRTKAICISNPNNPTGSIMTRDEMKVINDIAIKHDLWIIADEVYRELAFDGHEAISFGMFKEVADRVVIIDSVSKRFSACGARIGCAVTKNQDLIQALMKLAQGRLCVATLDQVGAEKLYRYDKSYFTDIKDEYEARRDACYEEIMKIPGAVCRKPGGALYMMVKLPIDDVNDFLEFLLTDFEEYGETVMFAPGDGFYATPGKGNNILRIAYVLNADDMRRAAQLIGKGLAAYLEKNDR